MSSFKFAREFALSSGLALLSGACGAEPPTERSVTSRQASLALSTDAALERPGLVVWGQGKVALFAAPDGTDLLSQFRQNGAWSPSGMDWDARFMALASAPEAISWAPGTIHVFARQADGTLAFEAYDPAYNPEWVLDNQWPHWAPIGKPNGTSFIGQPAPVSWATGRIDVFATAADKNVYIRSWIDGSGWFPPDGSAQLWNTLGGPVASSPTAISWGPNLLHIAVVGASGDLLLKAWNGNWVPSQTGWVSLGSPPGASFQGRPAMVSWQSGRLDIFARASDGNLYIKSWLTDHWVPEPGWASLGSVAGDPSVSTWGPERLHIAARQSDGTVGLKAYSFGSWVPSQSGWVSLGAPTGGFRGNPILVAPRSASGSPDELAIAVYGNDQSVQFKNWVGDHWLPSQTGWDARSSVPDQSIAATPVWASNIMQNESVMMMDPGNGGAPRAKLLVPASTISSVRDLRQSVVFRAGVDFKYDATNNQLLLLGNAAPRVTAATLQAQRGNVPEGHYYHDLQLAVTYQHSQPLPSALNAATGTGQLTRVRNRLATGQAVRIVLYGDSISAGLNASGVVGAPPYRPSWGQQLAKKLSQSYGSSISFENPSVAGQTSAWGASNVDPLVTSHAPDLVIIAFGMNDGSGSISACAFESNIAAMVDAIRARTSAEVILVAPMLPNPAWAGTTLAWRLRYRDALRRVATAKNTAFVDMTKVHQTLLGWSVSPSACALAKTCTCNDAVATGAETIAGPKTYQDQTGNDINHPNDWLISWYEMEVASLLLP